MKHKNKSEKNEPVWEIKPVAGMISRMLLGLLFAFSGLQKAAAPVQEFAAVVQVYSILPAEMVLPFATVMPWVELSAGLFLVAGNMTRASAGLIGIILLSFVLALLSALIRNIPLDNCGCFGSYVHLGPWQALALDLLLLGLAHMAYHYGKTLFSVDRWVKS